jgi:archaellum component FlaF (FlaF/FlaG flagellin family)
MSWDFYLCDSVSKEVLTIDSPHFMFGGTYCPNGTNQLHLNITYNYSKVINPAMFDVPQEETYAKVFNGKSALETIPLLNKAISNLSDNTDEDYWNPTEGNAKRALIQLLTIAKMRPDGIWQVS